MPTLIFGQGGHSRVVHDALDYIDTTNYYTRELGSEAYQDDTEFTADPINDQTLLKLYPKKQYATIVAIGDNQARERIFKRLLALGYQLRNVIHPTAIVGRNVKLGRGIYLGPYSVINNSSALGDGVIVNTAATIDHDCIIDEFTHIAPGVKLCGNVHIGARCLLGVGSSVIPRVQIGSDVVIGAGGAVVDKFIPAKSKLLGVPARSSLTESG